MSLLLLFNFVINVHNTVLKKVLTVLKKA